jgi:hypothetical protein
MDGTASSGWFDGVAGIIPRANCSAAAIFVAKSFPAGAGAGDATAADCGAAGDVGTLLEGLAVTELPFLIGEGFGLAAFVCSLIELMAFLTTSAATTALGFGLEADDATEEDDDATGFLVAEPVGLGATPDVERLVAAGAELRLEGDDSGPGDRSTSSSTGNPAPLLSNSSSSTEAVGEGSVPSSYPTLIIDREALLRS